MRLTKIIATIGPACDTPDTITSLLTNGMDVARLNFSHGSHATHRHAYETIRAVAGRHAAHVAILQDLSGPKIRIGELENGKITLEEGQTLVLTPDEADRGQDNRVFVNYPHLARDMRTGEHIFLADGAIELEVTDVRATDVLTRVLEGGELQSRKGLNLPMTRLDLPALTEKDRHDLRFGLALGVDMVALSFVRRSEDIRQLRAFMQEQGRIVPIIAKIEKPEALQDIDNIVAAADGIMIARGDLAIEIPMERVPALQKVLIARANAANIPVIVATQMLESMITAERPTRAEVADVANAVFDKTDAVMLSAETATGRHPAKVVRRMARILAEAEKTAYARQTTLAQDRHDEVPYAVAASAVVMAGVLGAGAMVTPTQSGFTAALLSRHRTNLPIIALSAHDETLRKLALRFGVLSRKIRPLHDFEAILTQSQQEARDTGLVKDGDYIIVTAGHPFNQGGKTNLIKAVHLASAAG